MAMQSEWKSEVRDYEVDFQGIVNNAVYFHYLDHARAMLLHDQGLNISTIAKSGINVVLINTQLTFKKSLTFGDKFSVNTSLLRMSRLKFLCQQHIYSNGILIVEAESNICCINASTGIPAMLKELDDLLPL